MIQSSTKIKIIEILGKSYSPKILKHFDNQNIKAVTGKQYTGMYIRSIVGGFQENITLEIEIMKVVLLENKKQKAIKKRIANL